MLSPNGWWSPGVWTRLLLFFFHFYFKYWGCLETLTISIAEFLSQVWSGFGYSDFFAVNISEKSHAKCPLYRFLLHILGPSLSIIFLF